MNAKELKELIEFLIEKDISEFELERGDFKVRMRRGVVTVAAPATAAPAYAAPAYAPPAVPAAAPSTVTRAASAAAPTDSSTGVEAAEEVGLHIVRSPIVGTFYEAASPGAPPFVKVGDSVHSGQVLCIIEAMKLMNEIEADAGGAIVKRYVENAQPVEYGQPLFAIRTS
jgi:acetyl-CoA carboxylase biotin carboxyl carrier protein